MKIKDLIKCIISKDENQTYFFVKCNHRLTLQVGKLYTIFYVSEKIKYTGMYLSGEFYSPIGVEKEIVYDHS